MAGGTTPLLGCRPELASWPPIARLLGGRSCTPLSSAAIWAGLLDDNYYHPVRTTVKPRRARER